MKPRRARSVSRRCPPQRAGEALGRAEPAFVFSTAGADKRLAEIVERIAPQGRFALIDDPPALDAIPFTVRSVSIHWESMFTRAPFGTPDVAQQDALLDRVSWLVDQGAVKTTLAERRPPPRRSAFIHNRRDRFAPRQPVTSQLQGSGR